MAAPSEMEECVGCPKAFDECGWCSMTPCLAPPKRGALVILSNHKIAFRFERSNLDASATKALELLSHPISVDLIGVERDPSESLK
jgi:hypothetical protein